jgi:hypothetical protein
MKEPEMLPAAAIYKILQFDDTIRSQIANEMTASLPIPSFDGTKLYALAFYFARMGLPPAENYDLYPPTWLVKVDWTTGRTLEIEEKEPADFGIAGDRFRPFAKVSYREMNRAATQRNLGDVVERTKELLEKYDHVVPIWTQGKVIDRLNANAFMNLFTSLTELPLRGVYSLLGGGFFGWLQR